MKLPHILIAEDDLNLQTLLHQALPTSQCSAIGINDGLEVLHYLNTGLPNMLILDWNLPNADGSKIVQYVRRRQSKYHVQIILLIGSQDTLPNREIQNLIDACLLKPVNAPDLAQVVERLLLATV